MNELRYLKLQTRINRAFCMKNDTSEIGIQLLLFGKSVTVLFLYYLKETNDNRKKKKKKSTTPTQQPSVF